GDIIRVDIEKGVLEVETPDFVERSSEPTVTVKKAVHGYLAVYAKLVSSADRGAIIENR
ncbi:MAG TPA: dihydroxy-acid dehydratase, partial [Firmicutes bacterium]|nr:dihydroxy-acid dehydratase [Bacillota bacterium]